MVHFKSKIFIVILSLVLAFSFLAHLIGFLKSLDYFKVIPILIDIAAIFFIVERHKWIIHAIRIWSAVQIIGSLVGFVSVLIVVLSSDEAGYPAGWLGLLLSFALIFIVSLYYILMTNEYIEICTQENLS